MQAIVGGHLDHRKGDKEMEDGMAIEEIQILWAALL
jgi:hypothetical protein